MQPFSTYRIQFRPEFGFDDAARIVPYLRDLGITHLYASPIFTPRRGSTHGYDVVDPSTLNPELGGEDAFGRLTAVLRENGMSILLDIVPNHMAASSENAWWTDVLEYGPASPYASFFDVDWTPLPGGNRPVRILLPILGKPYGEALEDGEIVLVVEGGELRVRYWEHVLPVSPDSWRDVLQRVIEDVSGHAPWRQRLEAMCSEMWQAREKKAGDPRLQSRWKDSLSLLQSSDESFRTALETTVHAVNGRKGEPESFDGLDHLLEDQWYRLSYWRTAGEAINYRRFFDVTDLVGVRVEDRRVMEERHARVLELVRSGDVGALRIDHIDGLFDPAGYLERLRTLSGGAWVVVEKILGRDENLPEDWACAGTTGYDFLARVNELFTDVEGLEDLRHVWTGFTVDEREFEEIVVASKKEVIASLFPGEMRSLGHELAVLATGDRNARDFLPGEIEAALLEVTAALDVYRTYVTPTSVPESSREVVERAVERATRGASPALDPRIFEFVHRVLLVDPPRYLRERRGEWAAFVLKWQQFTGRAMAKGVEDTTYYVHAPLLALNEVGGEPDVSAAEDTLAEFHEAMVRRSHRTMNALATHDTKRGEDARARLLVLSELASPFERRLREWGRLNHTRKILVDGRLAPSRSEESIIYQTLLGAWPMHGEIDEVFRARIDEWIGKALREAKTNTSWIEIHHDYEDAVRQWTKSILEDPRFVSSIRQFAERISWYGWINSLSQTLLRCTAPGVPDTYQGCEGWDLSLVDPDNRRPVDFDLRRSWLSQEVPDPRASWRDGGVKMHVLRRALAARATDAPDALSSGDYVPLEVSGPLAAHVCAFARVGNLSKTITVVPRLLTRLIGPRELPVGSMWDETRIEVHGDAKPVWRDVISGREVESVAEGAGFASLKLSDVLGQWPVALLVSNFSHES